MEEEVDLESGGPDIVLFVLFSELFGVFLEGNAVAPVGFWGEQAAVRGGGCRLCLPV